MKGIGGKPYIDCQEHIDLQTLKDMNMEICMGIAASDIKAGVYGPGVVESERYGNFMMMKSKLSRDPAADEYGWNRMTHNQQNTFAKLYFHLYNPSTVVYLREPAKGIDPLVAYRKKAFTDGWDWTNNVKNFPKLKTWLDSLIGTVFQEYGRILFFLHEHDCKLLTHRDGIASMPHRNEFLWINPTGIKKFFVYDETKDQRHDVNSPVAFFNDLDMHGGDTNECMTWTLRIDGVFTEEFRKRVNIDHLTTY
jgi:hypothetical protein